MAKQYEIVELDGTSFTPARCVSAVALLCGVSPKRQAEHDAGVLNAELGFDAYRAQPVRSAS